MSKTNKEVKITRGTKALIKLAISQCEPENRTDRYKICEKVAQLAEERYHDYNLDYQLRRMRLTSTKLILEQIDTYFYKYYND